MIGSAFSFLTIVDCNLLYRARSQPFALQEAIQLNALPEIRCRLCRRLLMKGEIKQVEIKCPKCGHVQIQRA